MINLARNLLALVGLPLLGCLTAHAASGDNLEQAPLPPNAFMLLDGSIILQHGPPLVAGAHALAVATTSPYLLPEIPQVKATNLTKSAIEDQLNVLFDNWPAASATYGQYFLMLPSLLNLKDAGVHGGLQTQAANTIYAYKPYDVHINATGDQAFIPLTVPQALVANDPFKPIGASYQTTRFLSAWIHSVLPFLLQ
jgi:hypothetical protein